MKQSIDFEDRLILGALIACLIFAVIGTWSVVWPWRWPGSDVWQAIFDFLLVLVGLRTLAVYDRQRRIMGEQNTIMKRQTEIATDQFNAAHRPRLRVRNFYIDIGVPANSGAFTGQFYVVNVGDSTAKVISSHIAIYWYNGELPMRRPFDILNPNNQFARMDIAKGDSKTAVLGPAQVVQGFNWQTDSPGNNIAIMGYIDYCDPIGTRRRTAFCRIYDHNHKRFTKSGNEDYEHEE